MSFLARLARLPFDLADVRHQRSAAISHPGALSDLNMPLGNTEVYTTDKQSLVTVIKIRGKKEYLTGDSHDETIVALSSELKAFIQTLDFDIGFYHVHNNDPEQSVAAVWKVLQPSVNVSSIQRLNNKSFFAEQVEILSGVVQQEETYMCLWTRRSKYTSNDPSGVKSIMPVGSQGTNGFDLAYRLADRHVSRVDVIVSKMEQIGFSTEVLSNRELGKLIAVNLDRGMNSSFEPKLFGEIGAFSKNTGETYDKHFTLRTPSSIAKGIKGTDYTAVFPPKLGYQVWAREPEYEGNGVKLGDVRYGSLMVTMVPDSPVAFDQLVTEAGRAGVPFRVAMKMGGDSKTAVLAKYVLANLLSILPGSGNKLIKESMTQIWEYSKRLGTSLSVQITFTTWAPADDPKKLTSRLEKLSTVIGSWGSSQSKVMSGDSVIGLLSTLPAYNTNNPAPAAVAPSEEALYLAPLTRPALPWTTGGVVFRSHTGKLMPFAPMSDIVTHHVYLVSGEPGYGKSLLCQMILIALVESQESLPYIAISDVGISSKGTVDYLRSILPTERKHQVAYYGMQNTTDYAINMNDLPLGLRHPQSDQKEMSLSMLLLGVADAATGNVREGTSDVLSDAIDIAYQRCSDVGPKSEPKRFQEAHLEDKYWESVIAPALDRIELSPMEDTTYWSMVDALYDAKEYRAAVLVQRFAMPLLKDIAAAIKSDDVTSMAKIEISTGLSLGEFIYQALTRMEKDFPVTQQVTQLDLGDARVVAFNLEDVCPHGNDFTTQKKGTIFFGLTSRLQTNKFFWNKERLKEIPDRYKEYHEKVVDSIIRTKNFYFADEQQRFSAFPVAAKIPEVIAAEGRKRNIGVMLASQRPVEFTDRMVELSTARFMVGFSKTSIPGVVERFKLNKTEEWLLAERIHMPGRNGSSMLVQFETEKGDFSQFVNLRVGQRRLWGLSTRPVSSSVRDYVTEEFGYEVGLGVLKRLYPSGEVESEYERRKLKMEQAQLSHSGLELVKSKVEIVSDMQLEIAKDAINKGREYFMESLDESNG